jgi:hypothetical protein
MRTNNPQNQMTTKDRIGTTLFFLIIPTIYLLAWPNHNGPRRYAAEEKAYREMVAHDELVEARQNLGYAIDAYRK